MSRALDRVRCVVWMVVGLCLAATVADVGAAEPKKKQPAATAKKPAAKTEAKPAAKAAPVAKPAKPAVIKDADLPWPPSLPGGKTSVTDSSPDFLKKPEWLKDDVSIAKTPPTIDFQFYPGQNYPGAPWSNWGDGSVHNGKYYSGVGDHMAVGRKGGDGDNGTGTGFVTEYDPETKTLRNLVDLAKLLNLPKGHYTPSKVHSRVDMGSDGWLYFGTHRGSPAAAVDANHYKGDWIFRTNPATGESEVVAQGPIAKHSTPNSVLDAERMIFYGGTAAGPDAEEQSIVFYAYDLKNKKLLYSCPNGPARYMMLAKSTGKLYYVPGNGEGEVLCYDPKLNTAPTPTGITMSIRAATEETKDGIIYASGNGQGQTESNVYAFDTKTEKAKIIGTAAVGTAAYIASLDVDPTGRFLYYSPGAHGSMEPTLVQFDIKTGKKKVIAFLGPYYTAKYGFTPKGTYSTAVSADGGTVFVTWNVSRGTRAWDCTGLTAIHIPESER